MRVVHRLLPAGSRNVCKRYRSRSNASLLSPGNAESQAKGLASACMSVTSDDGCSFFANNISSRVSPKWTEWFFQGTYLILPTFDSSRVEGDSELESSLALLLPSSYDGVEVWSELDRKTGCKGTGLDVAHPLLVGITCIQRIIEDKSIYWRIDEPEQINGSEVYDGYCETMFQTKAALFFPVKAYPGQNKLFHCQDAANVHL